MKKLRIATMVSAQFTTPAPYGVIYAPMDVATDIAMGLGERGHEVTYFCPEGSMVPEVKMESMGIDPLRNATGHHPILDMQNIRGAENEKIHALWDQFLIANMFKRAKEGEFDIVHIHPVDRALSIALASPDVPTVYTLHDPIFGWRADLFRMYASKNQHFVSISNAQRKGAPDLNYLANVYNGLPVSAIPWSETHEGYLLFAARLIPEKGVAEAVEVAKITGKKLLIVGPPTNSPYWTEKIVPHLNDQIQYIGLKTKSELRELYMGAEATLFCSLWEEPFGLVMTESMAAGTPVLGFRKGSVPEVINHGVTGFVVDTVDEMAEAVGKIGTISRKACREHVEKGFSVNAMAEGYEKAFLSLL